ncbi:minor capsid protein [Lachnospiraceae bacterium 54-53]
MTKKNDSYWKVRMAALEDERYSRSSAYYRDLEKQFREASNDIQMDIERWYNRLADNNGISYAKARKMLKANELEEFKWTVQKYITAGKENAIDERWMKELENASARYHISYLEAMKLQIRQHAELLFTAYEGGMTEFLQNTYSENYYHSAFEVARGTGVGSNLVRLDTKKIDTLIRKPWAQDGSSFSDRIWSNKEKLVNKLHTELSQSMIRGSDPKKAIRNLAQVMDVSRSQAGRLIMTESAAIASSAQKDCFKGLGVEQYEILATLDTRTSEICRDMDGKVFDMKDYEVGVTAPPFHPHCRTTTVPHFDDEFSAVEMRAARDPVTGKSVEVSASMTYKQWHEEFVKTDPQAVLLEKLQKNKASDKSQYERYKEILGKEAPKSLDSFQRLKYTDSEAWNTQKREYATISKIKSKDSYTDAYREKMLATYYDFKESGYEFTDHSLNRFLGQKSGKGKRAFGKEDLLRILDKDINYMEEGNRTVKFYDGLSIIQNKDTKEVVSVIARENPKKGWERNDK